MKHDCVVVVVVVSGVFKGARCDAPISWDRKKIVASDFFYQMVPYLSFPARTKFNNISIRYAVKTTMWDYIWYDAKVTECIWKQAASRLVFHSGRV